MKSKFLSMKKMDRKGVFGLTSVQAFFSILLGVALLAYVIIVIMGTLSGSAIVPTGTLSASVINETGAYLNTSNAGGYDLAVGTSVPGSSNPAITSLVNASGYVFTTANYTLVGFELRNITSFNQNSLFVSYTYSYNTPSANYANNILVNTSTGVAGFFSSINPVYAILAILVIILILVVLVRVVTGGTGFGNRAANPQL